MKFFGCGGWEIRDEVFVLRVDLADGDPVTDLDPDFAVEPRLAQS
jgi:hypothetical protein